MVRNYTYKSWDDPQSGISIPGVCFRGLLEFSSSTVSIPKKNKFYTCFFALLILDPWRFLPLWLCLFLLRLDVHLAIVTLQALLLRVVQIVEDAFNLLQSPLPHLFWNPQISPGDLQMFFEEAWSSWTQLDHMAPRTSPSSRCFPTPEYACPPALRWSQCSHGWLHCPAFINVCPGLGVLFPWWHVCQSCASEDEIMITADNIIMISCGKIRYW